jgi:hypothetical protein
MKQTASSISFMLIAGWLLGSCLFSFLFSSIVRGTYARLFNMQWEFWALEMAVAFLLLLRF